MPINYIPNDPQDALLPIRVVSPRPDRPADRAGFVYFGGHPEAAYDPATQPAEFVFWQCREAALAALDAWEDVSGTPLAAWRGLEAPARTLNLRPADREGFGAEYNRSSLNFNHVTVGGRTFQHGASTDVVVHEVGHAVLDALRPDLWGSDYLEVNAFHEAFGDCLTILAALLDGPTRAVVRPRLAQPNPVEAMLEQVAAAIRTVAPNHNAAAPRRALNQFRWELPETLPGFGGADDGPGRLVNEYHSFGMVFSGCFYDTVVNIFRAAGGATDAELLAAARTAGRLLARAVESAPSDPRFFRAVGRSMVKADEDANGGANRNAIKAAFEGHNLPLGTGAMLAPVALLAGAAPTLAAATAAIGPAGKRDLLARLRTGGGKLHVTPLKIGGTIVAGVVHQRLVPLDRLSGRLKGVVARAAETVLVGESNGRAAVLDGLPDAAATAHEVEIFVRSLLKKGAIDLGYGKAAGRPDRRVNAVTHEVRKAGGKKVLTRVRFACAGCPAARPVSTRCRR